MTAKPKSNGNQTSNFLIVNSTKGVSPSLPTMYDAIGDKNLKEG